MMRTASAISLIVLLSGLGGVIPGSAQELEAPTPTGSAWHSFESNANATAGAGASWYFGGMTATTSNDELWEFVAATTTWTKITPKSKKNPKARHAHAASYATVQELYIIFGGANPDPKNSRSQMHDDTWFYNPATNRWSSSTGCPGGGGGPGGGKKGGGTGPAARWFAAMAYNPTTFNSTLFGGDNPFEVGIFGDTWTLRIIDGEACWTNKGSLNPAPVARAQAAMAYVSDLGTVVLYGGSSDPGLPLENFNDLWEWNGTSWLEIPQSGGPSIRDHSLAFDEISGRLVVFGGQLDPVDDSRPSNSIFFYEFATNTWSEEPSSVSPARAGAPMAHDIEMDAFVIFGGTDGNSFFGDTLIIPIPR